MVPAKTGAKKTPKKENMSTTTEIAKKSNWIKSKCEGLGIANLPDDLTATDAVPHLQRKLDHHKAAEAQITRLGAAHLLHWNIQLKNLERSLKTIRNFASREKKPVCEPNLQPQQHPTEPTVNQGEPTVNQAEPFVNHPEPTKTQSEPPLTHAAAPSMESIPSIPSTPSSKTAKEKPVTKNDSETPRSRRGDESFLSESDSAEEDDSGEEEDSDEEDDDNDYDEEDDEEEEDLDDYDTEAARLKDAALDLKCQLKGRKRFDALNAEQQAAVYALLQNYSDRVVAKLIALPPPRGFNFKVSRPTITRFQRDYAKELQSRRLAAQSQAAEEIIDDSALPGDPFHNAAERLLKSRLLESSNNSIDILDGIITALNKLQKLRLAETKTREKTQHEKPAE
jgi:hypothetical protein